MQKGRLSTLGLRRWHPRQAFGQHELYPLTADLGHLLAKHGPGVYTVFLWGMLGGERTVISQYPIFHDIPRPNGYD